MTRSASKKGYVARVDPDRKHAIEVRFYGRMTWFVLAAAVALTTVVAFPPIIPKMIFLGSIICVNAALNVPAWKIVQRATREGVAQRLVMALWMPLILRAIATFSVVAFLANR